MGEEDYRFSAGICNNIPSGVRVLFEIGLHVRMPAARYADVQARANSTGF
ncbi:MAG TPA: hypothetical protein VGN04_13335 [Herbaspirillum sp.]